MPTILITGASGFIGSHLVTGALNRGWTVWVGLRPSSRLKNQSATNVQSIYLDYDHQANLIKQIKDAPHWDYVVHCAGLTKSTDTAAYTAVNTDNTLALARALMDSGKSPKTFLFMSSLEARGPVSAYGRSKLAAEKGLMALTHFPWLILRPTGVYGPGDKDYLVLTQLVKRGLAPMLGIHSQWLSFLYIEDLVTLSLLALTSGLTQKVWLVAHPSIHEDRAFIDLLQTLLNKKHVFKPRIPLALGWLVAQAGEGLGRLTSKATLINADKYRIMAVRDWTCDSNALQEDLGYTPPTGLKKGWTKTLAWYKANGWL